MNGPTIHETPTSNGGGDNPLYELAMYDLAQELAYAEQKNDTTAVEEISDVLLDKLIDEESKRIADRRAECPFDMNPTDWNNHISDTLWNEVISSPEKRKVEQSAQRRPSRADYQRLGTALVAAKEKKMQEPLPIAIASYSISQPRRQQEGLPPLVNGDTVLKNDSHMIYGVFDGVSGGPGTPEENAARAAHASRAAAEAVRDGYETRPDNPLQSEEDVMDYLKVSVISAREGVREHGEGGATTATFFKIEKINGQPHLAGFHIGDTRMLIQHEPRGLITQLTKDQSKWTPKGSMLFNALSSQEPPGINALDEFILEPIPIGSRVVLCSDGITGDKEDQRLTDEEMQEAFNKPTPAEAAQTFLALSKKNDDKSVIVIDINEAPPKQKPRPQAITAPIPNAYEKKKKHRRIAAVLGTAAVIGAITAIVVANNLGKNHSKPLKPVSPPPSQKQPEQPMKPETTPNSTPREHGVIRAVRRSLARQGTTIWGQSANFLQKNNYLTRNSTINNIIIDSVKDDVLIYQGKSEAAARELPVGYVFTIPRYSLVKAHRLKKQLTHQN